MIPVDCTIQAVTSRNKVAVDLFRRIVQVSRGKLRTLRRVPARMFAVAAVTFALTVTVRLALWLIPFRVIRRLVEAAPAVSFLQGKLTSRQIAWLVHVASRNVFRATCLTQALTAQLLLNGAGLENQLHIGVAVGAGAKLCKVFESHAWVECEGRVLVGGAEQSARFSKILTLEGRPRSGAVAAEQPRK